MYIFENDDIFPVDETAFHFEGETGGGQHFLGCLREYQKPYRVGYCDIEDGCEFLTAREMMCADIFDGRSIKDSWAQVIIDAIGGIGTDGWLENYKEKL